MRNERLKSLLKKFDLEKCTPIIDNHIYYIKTPVKQRCSCIGGGYRYITTTKSTYASSYDVIGSCGVFDSVPFKSCYR